MSNSKCFLVLLIVVAAWPAQADVLRLEVAFEEPRLTVTPLGDRLEIPGAELSGSPGEPQLPQRTFNFVLPYGHLPDGLQVDSIMAGSLAERYDIAPAQRPHPLSLSGGPEPTGRKASVYASDRSRPGVWARMGAVQYKRGFAVVPVTVYPLAYRPLSGRVTCLSSATLEIGTRPGGAVSWLYRALPEDAREAEGSFDMVEALKTYPESPVRKTARLDGGPFEYVIVTPEVFIDLPGENSLEALRDARDAGGMTANIVTLEWIRANYDGFRPDGAQDDATRIRDFLIDAYMDWTTGYVLLVGDADAGDVGGESGDNLLEVRKFYVDTGYPDIQPDYIPSDMYYGCLDGSFDHDADGRYGEPGDGPNGDEVDLMAELFVGRAPVDSAGEVQNFVAKTLAYEAAAGAWLQEVWMVGELLWDDPTEVWGGDFMDELITGSDSGGVTTLGFSSFPFFVPDTLYDRDMIPGTAWETSDIMSILNAGPHIVNHMGHSNVTYNMRLMNHNIDALINVHPFLHYSQGCYNGSFDNHSAPEEGNFVYPQDCIAEHMVCGQHGAFASVANSRYGWGSFMTDGPSQRFHRQFWDAFFSEGMGTIGQALADSKEDNAAGFQDPFIRWAGFENNLLGDPAAALKKSLNTTDPLLGIYPPQLSFTAILGAEAPGPQVLRVRNDGVGSLSFTAASDQSWAIPSPASGDAPSDVEVAIDPAGLAPGNHQARITFESNEATNSPLEALVELQLVEVPQVSVPHVTQELVVDGVIDPGEYDGALTLAIDPDASGVVTLFMLVSGTWLHLGVDDGLDASQTEWDRMRVYFDRDLDGLWPTTSGDEGAYMLTARNGGSGMFIPVFNPGDGARLDFRNRETNPPGLQARLGFSDNHRIYEMAIDLNESRIDVGPAGSFGLYMRVENSEQMGGGSTTGSWPPVVPETDTQLYFGRLDMTPDQPWLSTSPGYIQFDMVHNQEAPAAVRLSVVDLLGGNFAFTAGVAVSWLEVSPLSGQTPLDLSVEVVQADLDVGSHLAEIIVESAGFANSPIEVPVTLEVLPEPGRLTVDPPEFDISAVEDDPDPALELTVGNLGDLDMAVTVTPSEAWLAADVTGFSVPGGGSQIVTLTVALAGLAVGTQQAEILVETPDGQDGPVTVPVQVEVIRKNTAPPAPELLAPADGSEVFGIFELTATKVADEEFDPVTYTFELLEADDVVDSGSGQVTAGFVAWPPTAAMAVGTTYRWRVEAADDRGESSVSETWSFTYVSEPGSGSDCGCGRPPGGSALLLLCLIGLVFFRKR